MVVFWPEKNVSVNIVVPLSIVERVRELIKFNGCAFVERPNENGSVISLLTYVTGTPAHMSSLMKALEELEWDSPEKIYIMIKAKKGGKKNGKKAGTKAPAGREGGNPEGADRAPEYGEGPGVGGGTDSCGDPASGPEVQLPEAAAAADGCDQ